MQLSLSSQTLSLVALFFLFFVTLGERGHLLVDRGFELAQALVLAGENSLLPYEHFVELAIRHEYLVQATQVLRVGVHDAEHPESVVLHGFDGVSIQSQALQVFEAVKLLRLVQVRDVVAVKVERLQLGEVEQVSLDRLQVIVGQVEPDKAPRVVHHVFQHLR